METTPIYIGCALLVIFSLFALFRIIFNIQKQGKKDLIKEMYINNDIDKEVYFKYLNKIN